MRYLQFTRSEGSDGTTTLEAMAATGADRHAAVLAEVQQVLDWARAHFSLGPGPLDDGNDWDHDLQCHVEAGGWHTVTLTLTGTPPFVEAWTLAFAGATDD
jgi:hypothetical protein